MILVMIENNKFINFRLIIYKLTGSYISIFNNKIISL